MLLHLQSLLKTRKESANMESPEKTGLSDGISEIASNDKIGNVATPSNNQKEPDPKKSTTKRKRRTLTLEEKYKLVSAIKDGARNVEAAKLFDPPSSGSTISTILKEKHKIVRAYEEGSYSDKRKKMRQSDYPDLNKALSQWFRTVRTSNVPLSGPLLQEKARYFAEQLGYENFKASNGFLDRFKEREGITGQSVCGEEKSVDQDIVHAWSERLPDICRNYSPRDRYNADETGFFWKATPVQTLSYKGEKCTGGKKSKDRVTAMVACNQDGSDKLPLLVIGKYARPRCLKNTNMDLLPVKYKSQKNAWMDNTLYEQWMREIDRRMKAAKRNILLIVDNCTAHVTVNGLTNTKVLFLPPNCTSKLQPADQGIIQNLKVHYRQTMVRRMLQCLDEGKAVEDINIKDALFMMAKAWDSVSTKTIANCWKKAGFPGEVVEPSDDPFESDDEEAVAEDNDGLESLWERVGSYCPSVRNVDCQEFALLDHELVTSKQMSEAEATEEALDVVRTDKEESQDENEDSENEDCSIMEREKVTASEANAAVRLLRNFVVSRDKAGAREKEILRYLSIMEDTFLAIDVAGRKKQSTLKDFFK